MNEVLMRKVLPAGLGSALAGILSAGTVTVRPRATDEALVNPGMGWVFYKYSNRVWAYGANTPTEDTLDWCDFKVFEKPELVHCESFVGL